MTLDVYSVVFKLPAIKTKLTKAEASTIAETVSFKQTLEFVAKTYPGFSSRIHLKMALPLSRQSNEVS